MGHVKKAKEVAYSSDKKQDDECKDTKFVDHSIKYVMLPDGRRGVRVFLIGASGGKKLVASGDEEAKGAARYVYKKVDGFKGGPPLNTSRIGEVRTWLSKVLGQPLKAPVKRCISSFGKSNASSAKRRRVGGA